MKFEAKAADLARAATAAARIIDAKTKIPILHNLLLTASEGAVQVLGHDLDLSMAVICAADVGEAGCVAVPGERFMKLLAGLDVDVRIQTADTALAIKAGRSRYKLPTLPASDFPAPISAAGQAFELDADAVRRLFVVPQPTISTEETRYYLNGTNLQAVGNRLVATTTDGYRLIQTAVELPPDIGALHSVIIPRTAVVEIGKLARPGPIKLTIGAKHIEVSTASHRVGSKLIDGTFPDYARVIPARSDCGVVVDREDLIAALARIEAVAERAKNMAAVAGLTWGNNELTAGHRK
jgi:DNA polymerase-3 subunit beta